MMLNNKEKLIELIELIEFGDEIKEIINLWDPMGLMDFCPEDEYETEVKGIRNLVVNNKNILIGNKKLMLNNNVNIADNINSAEEYASEGKTPLYIAIDNVLSGIIAVADQVKDSSAKTVEELHKLGVEVVMLTGDNAKTAQAIAKELSIDKVISEVLPEDKANEIKKLQESGRKVAMVGDGINDAPALVQADVGLAIGTGTDVAIDAADVVLIKSDLNTVVNVINLSRKTIKNIKENLFWAFFYNVIGIPFAMGIVYLFGGPLLNPMLAGAAMSFSSVSVVLNALRLKRIKLN